MKAVCIPIMLILLALGGMPRNAGAEDWRVLASGLELREFLVPDQSGDLEGRQGVLAALRIDPIRYEFALGAALASGEPRTMQEWARLGDFAAVINAGMFRSDDRLRSTGFMRDRSVTVSDFLHPGYGAFLAFQPRDVSLPPVRWIDRKLDPDWQAVLGQYDGVIQNYRLLSRNRENLWSPSEQRHSVAAIAEDGQHRLLFIHCRPRLSLHEFAQALLDLPLELIGAMYVEGGADAAMYVETGGFVGRWVGEYQSDFFQGSNTNFWPAPNVLGIRRR